MRLAGLRLLALLTLVDGSLVQPPLGRAFSLPARQRCAVTATALAEGALPQDHDYIHGPIDVGCASAYVERHPELALPRMVITAHDPPMTDAAIAMFLEFLDEVFTQSDEPFSVLWNVRGGAFPTIAQFKTVIAWLDKDDRSTSWDRRVQGNAAIIRSPLLRAGARLMVSIAKPPQPSLACNDEEKALQWARDTCSEAREWA